MGITGPIPKRSDERVRRNKVEGLEKITTIGMVKQPDLGIPDPHHIVRELYLSLKNSAQARYYEPSDWQYARFALHFADVLLKQNRPSAQLLASVQTMLADLLVSEGARRRVRLEIDRIDGGGEVIDVADLFRQRLAQG